MIQFRCEYCQQLIRAADTSAGKKCRCPKCKQILAIPAVAAKDESTPIAPPLVLAPPPAPPQVLTEDISPLPSSSAPLVTPPPPPHPSASVVAVPPPVVVQPPEADQRLQVAPPPPTDDFGNDELEADNPASAPLPMAAGMAASALGVLATTAHLFPQFGIANTPTAVVGLFLAGVGLIVAITKRRESIKWPIAGAAFCLFPLLLGLLGGPRAGPTANAADASAVTPATTQSAVPSTPLNQTAEISGTQVRIKKARIGKVQIAALIKDDAPTQTTTDYLSIEVEIKTNPTGRAIHYRTWAGVGDTPNQSVALLRDDKGRICRRCDFAMLEPLGRTRDAQASPGASITDLLVFELRPEATTDFTLELPAANVDAKGSFRFDIPRASIEQDR